MAINFMAHPRSFYRLVLGLIKLDFFTKSVSIIRNTRQYFLTHQKCFCRIEIWTFARREIFSESCQIKQNFQF